VAAVAEEWTAAALAPHNYVQRECETLKILAGNALPACTTLCRADISWRHASRYVIMIVTWASLRHRAAAASTLRRKSAGRLASGRRGGKSVGSDDRRRVGSAASKALATILPNRQTEQSGSCRGGIGAALTLFLNALLAALCRCAPLCASRRSYFFFLRRLSLLSINSYSLYISS